MLSLLCDNRVNKTCLESATQMPALPEDYVLMSIGQSILWGDMLKCEEIAEYIEI